MNSQIKICSLCFQLDMEKEKCPKCGGDLKSIDEFASYLDNLLEHYRGLHIQYADPSYAEDDKRESIKYYYNAYMALLDIDSENKEQYLYGMVKAYDIFDKGFDYASELDCDCVLEILDTLLELNGENPEYLRLKVIYSYKRHNYEDVLKYADELLEMGIADDECKAYKKMALDRLNK